LIQQIKHLVQELSWLEPPPVFIGGATIGLYLDAFGRSQLRTTIDVDIIVPRITTYLQWTVLEAKLREHSWSPMMKGPICRYVSPSGILVDMLPCHPEILGFAGKWYPVIAEDYIEVVVDGVAIRIAQPAHLLASKIEAFEDRGNDDPVMSHDFEDIVSLVDGCGGLFASVVEQSDVTRNWIVAKLQHFQQSNWFIDATLGSLPRGGNQGDREKQFMDKWKRLTDL